MAKTIRREEEKDLKVTNQEYKDWLKGEKKRKIANSKKKDREWQKMIRNLDYEDLKGEKGKDDIVLQPKKIGKGLVK